MKFCFQARVQILCWPSFPGPKCGRPAPASNRRGRHGRAPSHEKRRKRPRRSVQGSPQLDQRMQRLDCGLAALDRNK